MYFAFCSSPECLDFRHFLFDLHSPVALHNFCVDGSNMAWSYLCDYSPMMMVRVICFFALVALIVDSRYSQIYSGALSHSLANSLVRFVFDSLLEK